jgi:hypothetical protein
MAEKRAIDFVMTVLSPARMEERGYHWTDFHEIWYFIIFRKKNYRENSFFN